ncbi:biotin transporter BioY [Pradoshia sp.]
MNSPKTRNMIIIAMYASILSILAQIIIPLPLIPITGQTLAVGLIATIIGSRFSTYTIFVYLALGIIGIPVFSGFTSGLGILFGPTGGYLLGFIPAAFFTGYWLEKRGFTNTHAVIANLLGMVITLVFGVLWLKFFASISWNAAFVTGFMPFLPVGILKAAIAAYLGILIRKRLLSARLLPASSSYKLVD